MSLALVADATDFGDGFYASALLTLPVVLLLGLSTHVRLLDANTEAAWLLMGMNRIRHGYLDLAPDLAPYFVTGSHDDEQGVFQSYGPGALLRPSRIVASTPALVGVIDAVVAGALAGLAAERAGASTAVDVALGAGVAAAVLAGMVSAWIRSIKEFRLTLLAPAFRPTPPGTGRPTRYSFAS